MPLQTPSSASLPSLAAPAAAKKEADPKLEKASPPLPEGFPAPDAHRMALLPRYLLARLNAMNDDLRAKGVDVIDLAMGNPVDPVQDEVIDELRDALAHAKNHRYTHPRGIPPVRQAFARHMQRYFGVELDAENEVIMTIGSKDALSHLCLAIIGPSDLCAVPTPAYMIHRYAPILAGGHTIGVPMKEENPGPVLLNDIKTIFQTVRPRPKVLILNFPHNPTGKTVEKSFYEEIVSMAKHYRFWVVNDFAYGHTCFDGYRAPSFMEVKGARDVGAETFTMSKPYNLAGWRVGFLYGNPLLVDLLARIKSYFDYGHFQCIQQAVTVALDKGDGFIRTQAKVYQGRRDALLGGLERNGWGPTVKNRAAMFTWQRIPEKGRGLGSLDFCLKLAQEKGVTLSPGGGFGEEGEGHVRIALVESDKRLAEAADRIGAFLRTL